MPKRQTKKVDPLIGVWRSIGEFGSQVGYVVSKKVDGYTIVALDASDGEVADVFEEKWDAKSGVLSFAAHWNSTGRFSRCRLQLISKNHVAFTYTYTDTEVLVRTRDRVSPDIS